MPEEEFDADEMRTDIARIREKLKRLDEERQATVEQLRRAMTDAERTLERRERGDGD